jgi:gas vesicle protein
VPERQGDFIAGLVTGAIIGGVIGGAIGVVLAPKLMRRHRDVDDNDEHPPRDIPQRLSSQPQAAGKRERSTRSFLDQTQDREADEAITKARMTLETKIAELNQAIRETRAQLLQEVPAPSSDQGGREDSR